MKIQCPTELLLGLHVNAERLTEIVKPSQGRLLAVAHTERGNAIPLYRHDRQQLRRGRFMR